MNNKLFSFSYCITEQAFHTVKKLNMYYVCGNTKFKETTLIPRHK